MRLGSLAQEVKVPRRSLLLFNLVFVYLIVQRLLLLVDVHRIHGDDALNAPKMVVLSLDCRDRHSRYFLDRTDVVLQLHLALSSVLQKALDVCFLCVHERVALRGVPVDGVLRLVGDYPLNWRVVQRFLDVLQNVFLVSSANTCLSPLPPTLSTLVSALHLTRQS